MTFYINPTKPINIPIQVKTRSKFYRAFGDFNLVHTLVLKGPDWKQNEANYKTRDAFKRMQYAME